MLPVDGFLIRHSGRCYRCTEHPCNRLLQLASETSDICETSFQTFEGFLGCFDLFDEFFIVVEGNFDGPSRRFGVAGCHALRAVSEAQRFSGATVPLIANMNPAAAERAVHLRAPPSGNVSGDNSGTALYIVLILHLLQELIGLEIRCSHMI
jgi:hypothetical protein